MGLQEKLKVPDKQFYNAVMIFCESTVRALLFLNLSSNCP
jgi:hypothetical protein